MCCVRPDGPASVEILGRFRFSVKLTPTPAQQPGLVPRLQLGIGEQLTKSRFRGMLFTLERAGVQRVLFASMKEEKLTRTDADQLVAGCTSLRIPASVAQPVLRCLPGIA